MAGEECGIMSDFSAIQEGKLDSCLKSTLKNCQGKWYSHEGYSTFGKDEEELPNLELFVQALETLQDAEEVEIRISSGYPLISVQEVDDYAYFHQSYHPLLQQQLLNHFEMKDNQNMLLL